MSTWALNLYSLTVSDRTFLNCGAHYDALHERLDEDVQFWVEQAREAGGSTLELACGTGRITLPVARACRSIVGIDNCVPYLIRARAKSGESGIGVQFVASDIRAFEFRTSFDLVIFPFRTVAVLGLSELGDCFACVRRHLEQGGRFIIDAYSEENQPVLRREGLLSYEVSGDRVEISHVREYDTSSRIETVTIEKTTGETIGTLRLRHHTLMDLTSALNGSGFEVRECLTSYGCPGSAQTGYVILVTEAI